MNSFRKCRVINAVCSECCDTVTARSAHAAGLISALIAAPGQLIGNAYLQSLCDHLSLCQTDERRFHAELIAASEVNGGVDCIVEIGAAIGIGVSGSVVAVSAVVNDLAAV